jgi:hypothetical protein
MIRIFKRRRPAPAIEVVAADPDEPIYLAWGLNPVQWRSLSDFQRRECRRTVTVAPNFGRAA